MPWVKLDDSFYDHPKVEEAGNELAGIFARSLSYCGKHLTDGKVPAQVARRLTGSRRLEEQMVAMKLWRENGEGFVIPDYLEFNPSKEKVKEERRKAAERKAKSRERSHSDF